MYKRICGTRRKMDLADRLYVSSEAAHSQPRTYAWVPNSACASAISGICVVGAKPSSACVRTAWASAGRLVD
jgi:hypothetical protein